MAKLVLIGMEAVTAGTTRSDGSFRSAFKSLGSLESLGPLRSLALLGSFGSHWPLKHLDQ